MSKDREMSLEQIRAMTATAYVWFQGIDNSMQGNACADDPDRARSYAREVVEATGRQVVLEGDVRDSGPDCRDKNERYSQRFKGMHK